jgi:hypothetical protein
VPSPHIWLEWLTKIKLGWRGDPCDRKHNVYRAQQALVDVDGNGAADSYGSCWRFDLTTPEAEELEIPAPSRVWFYLVTAENSVGEGSLGFASNGTQRPNTGPCP